MPGAQLLMLGLFPLEDPNRVFQTSGRVRVGGRVLAQDVGVAPQSAPARDDFFNRLLTRHQLLELGGQ